MNINQVVYVNLESRTDRKKNILRTLAESRVPEEIIRSHIATDANDHETFEGLCRAAIADGYGDRFEPYLENPPYLDELYWWVGIGDIACVWTKLRLFSELRESSQSTLILEDDCVLLKSFNEIQSLVSSVEADIVQLDYVVREGVATHQSARETSELVTGFAGLGEYALVVNNRGAQVLYDLLLHKVPGDSFHLDQKIGDMAASIGEDSKIYAAAEQKWVTRRKTKDSDRINADITNWQQFPNIFLEDGITGAESRKGFIEAYTNS